MTPTIHLARHAQAEHNVEEDYSIPDAPLTQLGREQAAKLNRDTVQNIQQTADLLIASPLTRTLQTTLLGFPVLIARLEAQVVAGEPKKGIVVQSRLQETGSYPCDTGRPREELMKVEEFVGIDFSSLENDWPSKKGEFDPERATERAKWVRKWLRTHSEKEIVVVAHGGILRRIIKAPPGEEWANCEVRQYKFKSTDDEEADLILIPTKEVIGTVEPASSELAQVQ